MHGLVNRAIECFVRDTYGQAAWSAVMGRTDLGIASFEAMLVYDPAVTASVMRAAAAHFEKPRESLLEDLGAYLVSHPNVEAVRRLLRFGGLTFPDFLRSLDDLADRAHLAVPDLGLPAMELHEFGDQSYSLAVRGGPPGFGHVMLGALRAMADDYGTLALLEHRGRSNGEERLAISLIDGAFSEGRDFALSPAEARGAR